MSILESQLKEGMVQTVSLDDKALEVTLTDGRVLTVPLAWFPRLAHGTPEERSNWSLIGRGEGIHWPDLDEDISIESLLAGRRSGEILASLESWLYKRSIQPLPLERESTSFQKPIAINIAASAFLTGLEAFFAQGQLSREYVLTSQRPSSEASYSFSIHQECASGQAVDPVRRMLLDRYPNSLPGGKRLRPREARKKRSRIAKTIAA